MICADFLAGANLESGNADGLLFSLVGCTNFYLALRNRSSRAN